MIVKIESLICLNKEQLNTCCECKNCVEKKNALIRTEWILNGLIIFRLVLFGLNNFEITWCDLENNEDHLIRDLKLY